MHLSPGRVVTNAVSSSSSINSIPSGIAQALQENVKSSSNLHLEKI
jgi:hypothetical protein